MQVFIVVVAVVAAALAAPPLHTAELPPCGSPPFLDMLPEEAKQAITLIWADYKEGDECLEQHAETKKVLDSLPPPPAPPGQEPMGPPPPPCGLPSMVEVLPEETKIGLKQIWEGYVDGEDCRDRQERTQVFLDVMNRKVMEKYHIPMPPPPCELPPFTAKLPTDAKEKVEAIWAAYKEGECSTEHEKTKAIIDSLSEEVKHAVLPPGPAPPVFPSTNPNEPMPAGPPPPPPPTDKKPDGPAPKLPPVPPTGPTPVGPPPTQNGVKPAIQPPHFPLPQEEALPPMPLKQ